MRRWKHAAAAAAGTMLIAQPCLAASEFRGDGATERHSGTFAGVRLRLPIGAGNPERPSASMQLTTFHDYRNAPGATVRTYRPDGLELGLNDRGRASFMIAGKDMSSQGEQLGISRSTKTALIIGAGLVVFVVVLLPVLTMDEVPFPDLNDSDNR